jgi:hypothetical protein
MAYRSNYFENQNEDDEELSSSYDDSREQESFDSNNNNYDEDDEESVLEPDENEDETDNEVEVEVEDDDFEIEEEEEEPDEIDIDTDTITEPESEQITKKLLDQPLDRYFSSDVAFSLTTLDFSEKSTELINDLYDLCKKTGLQQEEQTWLLLKYIWKYRTERTVDQRLDLRHEGEIINSTQDPDFGLQMVRLNGTFDILNPVFFFPLLRVFVSFVVLGCFGMVREDLHDPQTRFSLFS